MIGVYSCYEGVISPRQRRIERPTCCFGTGYAGRSETRRPAGVSPRRRNARFYCGQAREGGQTNGQRAVVFLARTIVRSPRLVVGRLFPILPPHAPVSRPASRSATPAFPAGHSVNAASALLSASLLSLPAQRAIAHSPRRPLARGLRPGRVAPFALKNLPRPALSVLALRLCLRCVSGCVPSCANVQRRCLIWSSRLKNLKFESMHRVNRLHLPIVLQARLWLILASVDRGMEVLTSVRGGRVADTSGH